MHSLTEPVLRFFADVSVQVGMPQDVGLTLGGKRRVVPILGGEVCGQGWTARVLPGGADFQRILNDQVSELDARYVLETDAGDMIFVQNRAVRTAARRELVPWVEADLACGFELANAVHGLLAEFGGEKLDEAFDEAGLRLRVRLPDYTIDPLARRLRDISRGAASLRPDETPPA